MVIFGISTADSEELDHFIYKTNERFNKVLFFTGKLFKFKDMVVIDMKPLIVKFYYLGLFSAVTIYYFWGFSKLLIPAFIVFAGGFFWTRYFFYFFLKIGLKKEGHTGKIKLISSQNTLRGVLYGAR